MMLAEGTIRTSATSPKRTCSPLGVSISRSRILVRLWRVSGVLRQTVRASSAVECMNSVLRMHQSRHRTLTQGLLDLFTIRHYKRAFRNLTVAIVGDVLHSRVARSLIHGLTTMGAAEVRAIGPQTLLPTAVEKMGVRVFHDMKAGLAGCDVIVMLRLQTERMKGSLLPSAGEFFKHYGLTADKLALAKPDAIVMHPGPMNRGVEIDSAVADGKHSVILPQVTFGIAVRMAVMSILGGG